jgi:hypothetical protein
MSCELSLFSTQCQLNVVKILGLITVRGVVFSRLYLSQYCGVFMIETGVLLVLDFISFVVRFACIK